MWRFTPTGGGYYEVNNGYNDYCLDVAYVSMADGAAVVQSDCWAGPNQQWRFNLTPDGYFEMLPQHSQKCLDISWSYAVQWACHTVPWERFQIR
jgi:Ricin-type beta-trefoil lectin domain-like